MSSLFHQAMMGVLGISVTVDSFDTNDLVNYLAAGDGSATWSMGSGLLTTTAVSAGAQATLTRLLLSKQDGYVEVDMTQANDGGIVFNRTTNNDYLMVAVDDASSTSGNVNKVRLFTRVGGSFTQVGSTATIAFTRGTSHTIRLTRSGTAVSVSFDGTVVITGTDSGNNKSGTSGMRANGTGSSAASIWQEVRWSP